MVDEELTGVTETVGASGTSDYGQGADLGSAGTVVDEVVLAAMVSALCEYDAAKNLNREILEDICIEALASGKINDFKWLEKKLSEVTGDEVALDPPKVEVSAAAMESAELSPGDVIHRIQISPKCEVAAEEDMKEILRLHEVWMNSVLDPRAEISAYRANLRGANLSGFDLVGVNLSCADFRNATMIGTNFRGANLSNAWLQGANLQGANLCQANLKRAKLDGTDLRDADLEGVDLETADFSKAILKGRSSVQPRRGD